MTPPPLKDRLIESVDLFVRLLPTWKRIPLFNAMEAWELMLLGHGAADRSLIRRKLQNRKVISSDEYFRRGDIWHKLVPELEAFYEGTAESEIAAVQAVTDPNVTRRATLAFWALVWRQGRPRTLAMLKDVASAPLDPLTEELLVIGAASVLDANVYVPILDHLSEGALLSILSERNRVEPGIDSAQVVGALCRKDLARHRFADYHLNVAAILLPWLQSGDDPLAPRVRELIDRWAQLVERDTYKRLEAQVRLQFRELQPFDAKFVVWLCQTASDELRALGREILAAGLILPCRTASRAL